MAKLIDMAETTLSHVQNCDSIEHAIRPATRHCLCNEGYAGETVEVEAMSALIGTPMRLTLTSCAHARVTTHRCPLCGYTRQFGSHLV